MNSLKAGAMTFQRSRPGLFVKKVMDDQAANLAALLAWGTLSALLPLLLGMLSLAGFILRDSRRMDEVYNSIVAVLPSQVAGPVTAVLEGMRQQSAASAGIVAILLLLFNGSGFFSNMAGVFDKAYHVEPRNFIVERLVGIGLLLVTTALLVASTLAAGLGSLVGNVPIGLPIGTMLGRAIGWSIPVV
ncbi:MAG TPA: YhjD/YihY/BrkB family envelope integrity protein, partial [Anaerolineae bacterium]